MSNGQITAAKVLGVLWMGKLSRLFLLTRAKKLQSINHDQISGLHHLQNYHSALKQLLAGHATGHAIHSQELEGSYHIVQ
jgi:hypothetical protein